MVLLTLTPSLSKALLEGICVSLTGESTSKLFSHVDYGINHAYHKLTELAGDSPISE